jgi:hypothetical protein
MRTFKLSRNRERYPSLLGSYSSLLLILVFGIGIFFVYLQINQGSFILAKKNKVEIQVIGRDIRNEALWPGVPVEQLGHSLVTKGVNFLPTIRSMFENKNLDKLHEFLSLYENRPDKVNLCGIRINHALALFATIKHLKPSAIIESGVNAGVSTYIMRGAAGPNVKIFSIDPLENPICGQSSRWIDKNSNTEYFTGTKFKDFSEIDWNIIMKDNVIDPKNVLVYFDDHLNIFDRFPALMKNSFRHVLLEDNYKVGEGKTRYLGASYFRSFIKMSAIRFPLSNVQIIIQVRPLVIKLASLQSKCLHALMRTLSLLSTR